ncbi:DnaJ domain-containing protein [Pontibacter sp. 13R65]|uniref:DnaJ domain-containing protein n=1 Tax=Pontibacter sp. 13R65 TaxID=3127458 RepID=UPI00301E160E
MIKNYYLLLGIEETASQVEIKDAYRKLSKKIHPDLNQGERFFENYFKEIQEAYAILSNNEKKRTYDTRRFSPSEFSTNAGSKHLQFQLSRLELKISEQNQQLATALEEKKSLNQELEYFIKTLFEVKTDRNELKVRVQELEMEVASLRNNSSKNEKASGAEVAKQMQKKLHDLELEHQQVRNGLKNQLEELEKALAGQQRLAQEKTTALALAHAEAKQYQQQVQAAEQQAALLHAELNNKLHALEKEAAAERTKISDLEQLLLQQAHTHQQLLHTKEQELAQEQQAKLDLQRKLQEQEEEAEKRKNNLLHDIQELRESDPEAFQAHVLQARISELETEATTHTKTLQQKINELQKETKQKLELQERIEQLDLQAQQQESKLEEIVKEKEAEVVHRESLLQNIADLQLQLQNQQHHLQLQTEELEDQEKQKQTLQQKIQALELEADSQESIIQHKVTELAQETLSKKELQKTLLGLELDIQAKATALDAKVQELEQEAKKQQHLQTKVRELEQEQVKKEALQKKVQELEQETSSQKKSLFQQARDLDLEKKQQQQLQRKIEHLEGLQANGQLKEQELTKEMASVKSKIGAMAKLQPFMVEKLDFFNSNQPEVFSDSFIKQDIKYIFSRLKVTMLADKPGRLNVLVKYIKPNGELYFNPKSSPTGYSFAATISYAPQEQYINLTGWGSDRESTFVLGDHRVEIYTENGRQLSKANFVVKDRLLNISKIRSFF